MTANEIANKHTGFFGRLFGKKEALLNDILEYGKQNGVAAPSNTTGCCEAMANVAYAQCKYCVKVYLDNVDTVKNKEVMATLMSNLVPFDCK